MDNITHSLVGALIGARVSYAKKIPAWPLVVVSILANNFPDADLFYASFLSRPFGYLLHHRGHTHTILGALVCAVCAWFVAVALSILFRKTLGRRALGYMALLSVVGCLVHLSLDWLNTYGVHPFWPFVNNWIYGDTIFIIEPTLWISLALGCFALATKRWLKFVSALPVVLSTGLIFGAGKLPPVVGVVIVTLTGAVYFAVRHRDLIWQAAFWGRTTVGIVLLFFVARNIAQAELEKITAAQIVNDKQLVSFVSPAPANPLCWSYTQVMSDSELVKYRRGEIQLFNSLIHLDCKKYSINGAPGSDDGSVFATSSFKSLQGWDADCRWNAFRRFSRVPGVISCGDNEWCTTDYRFSRSDSGNFSNIQLKGSCPSALPPWDPPLTFPWE